jgi:hypothetical protein
MFAKILKTMLEIKKEYKDLLLILDKILYYIVNKTENYKVNFYKMSVDEFQLSKKEVNDKTSTSNNFESLIEEIFANFKEPLIKSNDLRLATIHLHNEGLIIIDSKYNIEITFKGLLAYSEGIAHKWDLELSFSQRLQTLTEENALHQNLMSSATVEMNQTNKGIRDLTRWVVIGTFVASVYYFLEILKVFYPAYFPK